MYLEYIDVTNEEYCSYFRDDYYKSVDVRFSDTTITMDISDFNKLIKDIIKNEEEIIIKNLLSEIQEKNKEE